MLNIQKKKNLPRDPLGCVLFFKKKINNLLHGVRRQAVVVRNYLNTEGKEKKVETTYEKEKTCGR